MTQTKLDTFRDLIRQIFQIDHNELDFGLYRIMRQKSAEIDSYLKTELPKTVDAAFTDLLAGEKERLEAERDRLYTKVARAVGEDGKKDVFDDEKRLRKPFERYETYKPETRENIRQFGEVWEKLEQLAVREETSMEVYDRLFTFFSRYYDSGDFLSQPRPAREAKYSIPYNGQETYFHWANKDQYYIKTGERLSTYQFKLPDNQLTVRFQVVAASTPQNNNKASRFYTLADEPLALAAQQLTLRFAYRPLSDKEQKAHKKQSSLNQALADTVLARLSKQKEADPRWHAYLAKSKSDSQSVLLSHLNRFTRRQTSDFFIHKNLQPFLTRELHGYIQREMLGLDLLLTQDGELNAQQVRLAQTVRRVGESLIGQMAQLENYQKRLYEKKKLVLETAYIVTMSHVPETLWGAVLANEAQMTEWRTMLGLDALQAQAPMYAELNDDFLRQHLSLTIDTRHFDTAFVDALLGSFDDLEAAIDGRCLHSDNWQALNLLQARFAGEVDCIYIDPPYNTGGDGFLYRDGYQHSSWLSMMAGRLDLGKKLLGDKGVFFSSIDDDEHIRLRKLMDATFSPENFVANIIWQKKYAPQNDAKWLSDTHDHILLFALNKESWRPIRLPRTDKQNKGYKNPDDDERGRWKSDNYLSNKSATQRPNLYYPIINPHNGKEVLPPKTAVWRYSKERHGQNVADNRVWWGINGDNSVPSYKRFLSEVGGVAVKTIWEFEEVGHNQDGVRDLQSLFGLNPFASPKPSKLLQTIGHISGGSTFLDYFAGSGTTGHAVINLNRQDGGARRYILVEMGAYFETVLLPRLRKVLLTERWKGGEPQGVDNQMRHLIQVQRLEQYEDTLNNMKPPPGELPLESSDPLKLRYLLDLGQDDKLLTLKQLHAPFAYRLTINDGMTAQEQPVDMVNSFNTLLGLRVQKRRAFADGQGMRWVGLLTMWAGQQTVVAWRANADVGADRAADQAAFVGDEILPALLGPALLPARLLVNGQLPPVRVAGAGELVAESLDPLFFEALLPPEEGA